MKKLLFLSLFISILFCSCSNFLFSGNNSQNESDDSKGKLTLSFTGDMPDEITKNEARLIEPAGDTSNITSWSFIFKQISDGEVTYTTTQTKTNTDFDDNPNFYLPVGTYTIEVTGTSSSEGYENLIYTGSKSDVEIVSGDNAATIEIGRKKTEEGKGSFTFTIPFSSKITSDCIFAVSLTNLKNAQSYATEEELSQLGLTVTKSDTSFVISSSSIPSGFYKIKLNYTQNGVSYELNILDPYIEISDNCASTEVFSSSTCIISKDYYVTMNSSEYYGITEEFPANLTNLLAFLKSNTLLSEVNIYFPETEDISEIDFTGQDYNPNITFNFYHGDSYFFTNGPSQLGFAVSSTGLYQTVNSVSQIINDLDCSDKNINIIISGTVTETSDTSFGKQKSVTISGASSNPDTDILDWNNAYETHGLSFDNSDDGNLTAVKLENIQIKGTHGASSDDTRGQFAGLKFGSLAAVTIDITNCKFSSNTAGSVGESILFHTTDTYDAPTATLSGCTFSDNGASGDDDAGVVNIINSPLNLIVENCTFSNNGKNDICIQSSAAAVTVNNSVFTDNSDSSNIKYADGSLTVLGNSQAVISVASGKIVKVDPGLFSSSSLTLNAENEEQTILKEIIVSSYANLLSLSNLSNNGDSSLSFENYTITVTDDIIKTDSDTAWVPISSTTGTSFKGTFDGNGKTISIPMTEFTSDAKEYGFTGIIGVNEGTILNTIYYLEGYSENNGDFVNCEGTNGDSSAGTAGDNVWTGHVGGISAINKGTIKNCWNRVNICTPFLRAGGIAGWNNGTIENCLNTGKIAVYNSAANGPRVGGIAGAMDGSSTNTQNIINCVNYGTIGVKDEYTKDDISMIAGSICGGFYTDDDNGTSVKYITNCYFAENSVKEDEDSYNSDIINLNDYSGTLSDVLSITGCGTISYSDSAWTITAGTASGDTNANCCEVQTLAYGTNLLTALNSYVTANSSSSLKAWTFDETSSKVILSF